MTDPDTFLELSRLIRELDLTKSGDISIDFSSKIIDSEYLIGNKIDLEIDKVSNAKASQLANV